MKVAAIIAAAGSGLRMSSEVRKQFMFLEGIPVLAHSLNLFLNHQAVGEVVAVVPPGEEEEAASLISAFCPLDRVKLVAGGATRYESVKNGLARLEIGRDSLICIHDAARPLASPELLDRLLLVAAQEGAAIPALKLSDTVKEVDSAGFVVATPQRENLRLVQTPQVFLSQLITTAYERYEAVANADQSFTVTDDASLVELIGRPVATVPGEQTNLKITTPEDLVLAATYLKGGLQR